MLSTLRLATKLLWREWRAGEWFILCSALFLAVTATTAIHFYTDRINRGLDKQGATFLGGDMVVSSSTPIPVSWLQKAQQLRLRTAQVWSYPSVVSVKNKLQLVNLQAVSDHYPLLSGSFLQPDQHTVWVEPRLLPLLSIKINDTIQIGLAHFQVRNIFTNGMGALNTGWIIAPRVMMRLDDVPATRTIIPGSRVDYRLLIVGDKSNLHQFKQWIDPQLNPSQIILDVHSQKFPLQIVLQHAENYLQLILLVCLMMSGVAIVLSIQQYMRRHYSHVALWRCLGAKQQHIIHILIFQLFIIAFLVGMVAIVLGYVVQEIFVHLFNDVVKFPLPAAGFSPLILGFMTSIFFLFAFSYPVIRDLPRTSPLYIWRNEIRINSIHRLSSLVISLSLVIAFVYWFMDSSLLTLYFICGLLISVTILYGLVRLILYWLGRIVRYSEGSIRRGVNQLIHHPNSVSLQFIGFNLLLIALIVLGIVRGHLIEHWQQSLPKSTPNYFAFNIAYKDILHLQTTFQQLHIHLEGIYPMVRGRLVALNGIPILRVVPETAKNNNALYRDLNLSWMWEFPSDNKIVSGSTWTLQQRNAPLVSVEYALANDLQLHIGDKLTFQLGEKKIDAIVTNFRTVVWSSIHPNFFMIFPPGLFDGFSTTYITSFHLDPQQTMLLNKLVSIFPNITIIDMASVVHQLQDLIGKIIAAIQYIFIFALGAGILIFMASLQASRDERRQTYYLLRVLGANRPYIWKSMIVEFSCLVIVVTLTSISFALLIVFLLERYIFTI